MIRLSTFSLAMALSFSACGATPPDTQTVGVVTVGGEPVGVETVGGETVGEETGVGQLGAQAVTGPALQAGALVIASWNLEHLAQNDGSGCRPRAEADYVALRAYADALGADVIAIQEVENVAAAERVFDPSSYDILLETRTGSINSKPPCYGAPDLHLNRQAVGFAIRKGLLLSRHDDLTALQAGDPNLRSGVDVSVGRPGHAPVRLLAVHLKSGCAGGGQNPSCETLARQAEVLQAWIDARLRDSGGFAILGDFNRRLANPDDAIWSILDRPPGPADLTLAAGSTRPRCDPRYDAFIDHIVMDPQLTARSRGFSERLYPADRLSDHCALSIIVGN